MFFQKLLGNFSVFSTFTIEEIMRTKIWNLQYLRNSLETLLCFSKNAILCKTISSDVIVS